MGLFDNAYGKWRNLLFKANYCIALIVFSIEIIMYFVLKSQNLILQPLPEYLIKFLFIPTVINGATLIIGSLCAKSFKASSPFSNYIPLLQLTVICTVVASAHHLFRVTLSIFCFPLFIATFFASKKMINSIFLSNLIGLLISVSCRKFFAYAPESDIYFFPEVVVALFLLTTSYIVCKMLIHYQEEKNELIHQNYLRQIEMQEALNLDQKTGLYCNTVFMNTLNCSVQMQMENSSSLTLAIMDIDDFKVVNDTYGHVQGDVVIYRLAEIMKNACKDNNYFPARFGGEEFAIIFDGISVEHAYEIIEKIRIDFQNSSYSFTDKPITLSGGVAKYEDGWTSKRLFDNADKAMYCAKRNGKNHTVIYEETDCVCAVPKAVL